MWTAKRSNKSELYHKTFTRRMKTIMTKAQSQWTSRFKIKYKNRRDVKQMI